MNHQERRRVKERLETPYAIEGNEIASRIFDYITEGLQQGMKEGSIRKEINIDTFLVLLFAQIYGIMHTIYSKEDVYEDIFHLDTLAIEKSGYEVITYFLQNQ
jgi:hypothetical protein